MDNMLQTALTYLNAGLSVIPIRKGDKKPALDSWGQYGDRLPTEDEVMEWFSKGGNNIGIVTGPVSGIIVVDVDDESKFPSWIQRFPTDRIVKSPHGYHLYYRYEAADVRNSVKAVEPGIDVRGFHGYVVAPPSAGYSFLKRGEPKYAIPGMIDVVRGLGPMNVQTAQQGPINNDRDAATLYDRVVKSGFTPGAHNQELKDVARYLYRMGEPENVVISTCAILNAKDPTPLPEIEMLKTIKSGLDYERKRIAGNLSPQAREVEALLQGKVDRRMTEIELKAKAIEDFDAIPYGELQNAYGDPSTSWLIHEWLPQNAVMVTAAPPESYKTWLALEAGINIAFGHQASPFLGSFDGPTDGSPILIVQQEDYMGLLIDRLQTIISAKTHGAVYDYKEFPDEKTGETVMQFGSVFDAPIYLHTKSALSFEDDNSLAALDAKIAKYGIKYVMIDPLYMLGRADDYFASLARKMSIIKGMRDKYGTTFMFVHHNKKNTKNGKAENAGERENMFGSQLLNGSFEGVWLLNQLSEKERIITRRGKVFPGTMDKYLLNFDISTKRPEPVTWPIVGELVLPDGTVKRIPRGTAEVRYNDNRRYIVRTTLVEDLPYDDEEQAIVDYVLENKTITAPDVVKLIKTNRTTASAKLGKMVARRILEVTEDSINNRPPKPKIYQITSQN